MMSYQKNCPCIAEYSCERPVSHRTDETDPARQVHSCIFYGATMKAGVRARRRTLTGAVSGNWNSAISPMMTPQNMYHDGESGFPVARISHATRNCAEPPNTEMARA